MKKRLLLICLLLAFVCSGCKDNSGGFSGIDKPNVLPYSGDAEAAEPLAFQSLRISRNYCTAENYVTEIVRTKSGVYLSRYVTNPYDGDTQTLIYELEGDAALYDQLAQKAGACHVADWDGFDEYAQDVLDGDSFTFEAMLSDGTSLQAYGSNAYPKGFQDFVRYLSDLLDGVTIHSAEVSTQYFTMTVPEGWVNQVHIGYGVDSFVFELPVESGSSYLFRMDLCDYGYCNSDAAQTTRIGRLVSGQTEYYVSAYLYDYGIKADSELSVQQQAIYQTLEADLSAALATMQAAEPYTLIPEDGQTLYESDAAEYFSDARSLWLNLTLGGEYGGMSPTTINGKEYRPFTPTWDVHKVKTIEEIREQMLVCFSEALTDTVLKELQKKKELIEYDGQVYVAYNKIQNAGAYGSFYTEKVEQTEEQATVTVHLYKAAPDDALYQYSDEEERAFHMERTPAGTWVFTDFDYWD